MTVKERNAVLQRAAEAVAEALPGHYGSVRFNMQDGRVVNVNIEESVKLPDDSESGS